MPSSDKGAGAGAASVVPPRHSPLRLRRAPATRPDPHAHDGPLQRSGPIALSNPYTIASSHALARDSVGKSSGATGAMARTRARCRGESTARAYSWFLMRFVGWRTPTPGPRVELRTGAECGSATNPSRIRWPSSPPATRSAPRTRRRSWARERPATARCPASISRAAATTSAGGVRRLVDRQPVADLPVRRPPGLWQLGRGDVD